MQPRVPGLRGLNAKAGRRSARRLGRLITLAAGPALATGCGSSLGLPPSATEQGDAVTDLWRVLVIMAGLVTLLIWLLTAFVIIASVRRRRREGRDGVPVQHQSGGDGDEPPEALCAVPSGHRVSSLERLKPR